MKILLLNTNIYNQQRCYEMQSDYMQDCLLHGLRQIKDVFTYDYPKLWHLYKNEVDDNFNKIWGKGFSITGLLPNMKSLEDNELDDINWDYIVVPIHHTRHNNQMFYYNLILHLLNKHDPKQIIVVDGHDLSDIYNPLYQLCQTHNITYFKRELLESNEILLPIHFGIPKEKISDPIPYKERKFDIAPLIPVNHSIDDSYSKTYIYNNEEDYYNMYRNSKFALTSKKANYDCMRHYEILACGCLPWFVDIENCPQDTLFDWPKELLIEIKKEFKINWNFVEGKSTTDLVWQHCGIVDMDNPGQIEECDEEKFEYYVQECQNWLRNKGTTEAVARYMLANC